MRWQGMSVCREHKKVRSVKEEKSEFFHGTRIVRIISCHAGANCGELGNMAQRKMRGRAVLGGKERGRMFGPDFRLWIAVLVE